MSMKCSSTLIFTGLVSMIIGAAASAFAASPPPNASSQSRTSIIKEADDAMSLRELRRVGVGLTAAGATGIAGVNLEVNFAREVGGLLGFGIGHNFQTLQLQVKRYFGGGSFLPFLSGGITHWYSVGTPRPAYDSSPSYLSGRFLSEREKRSGEFAETMIYPSAGIQYLQLHGPWAGASLFAEVMMLLDLDDLVSAATGSMGIIYYF